MQGGKCGSCGKCGSKCSGCVRKLTCSATTPTTNNGSVLTSTHHREEGEIVALQMQDTDIYSCVSGLFSFRVIRNMVTIVFVYIKLLDTGACRLRRPQGCVFWGLLVGVVAVHSHANNVQLSSQRCTAKRAINSCWR